MAKDIFPNMSTDPWTLTKAQLRDSIHKQVDLPKTRSAQLVGSLLEIIKKTLESGDGENQGIEDIWGKRVLRNEIFWQIMCNDHDLDWQTVPWHFDLLRTYWIIEGRLYETDSRNRSLRNLPGDA